MQARAKNSRGGRVFLYWKIFRMRSSASLAEPDRGVEKGVFGGAALGISNTSNELEIRNFRRGMALLLEPAVHQLELSVLVPDIGVDHGGVVNPPDLLQLSGLGIQGELAPQKGQIPVGPGFAIPDKPGVDLVVGGVALEAEVLIPVEVNVPDVHVIQSDGVGQEALERGAAVQLGSAGGEMVWSRASPSQIWIWS